MRLNQKSNNLLFIFITLSLIVSSCSGNATSTVNTPVSFDFEDGATEIDPSESFVATFKFAIDTNTINSSSFFIATNGTQNSLGSPAAVTKYAANFDTTLCNHANAIDATIECSSDTSCTLTPIDFLDSETNYSLCLTTSIRYQSRARGNFSGYTSSFATSSSNSSDDSTDDSNDSDDNSSQADSYTVGGTVSGLSGTVVLQNNDGDDLSVTENGSFTFSHSLDDEENYSVSVKTNPSTQTCLASNNSGVISAANVTNVSIACTTNTFTVTPSGDGNVGISPSSAQTVSHGSTTSFTVTANSGYALSNTVGGTCAAGSWAGAVYTTGAVTQNCSVSFSATLTTYSVTPSGDGNVGISPSSAQTVSHGSTTSFTVTANSGYALSNTVGGTCAAGSWAGAVYTTGVISSTCTVTFSATEIPLRLFVTDDTISATMGLAADGDAEDSLDAADDFCQDAATDAGVAAIDGRTIKAIFLSENLRTIADIFEPSTTYYRADGETEVFSTDGDGNIATVLLQAPNPPFVQAIYGVIIETAITDAQHYYWAGFYYDSETGEFRDGGNNCANWTKNDDGFDGDLGDGNAEDQGILASATNNCAQTHSLLCVETIDP